MINSHQSQNSHEHPRAAWVTLVLLALSILNSEFSTASAQGTAFTYQGRLNANGVPANGFYDLQFSLFDATTNGNQVGAAITNLAVGVTNGLFTTTMDFGPGIFNGNALWLQIGVETNDAGGNFTILGALQPLTATPYAIHSANAASATTAIGVANDSVTSASIVSGQVVKNLNGLMDAVTLVAGPNITLTPNGNTLTISGTGSSESAGWSLTGNAGTTAGLDFLGTTDNQPLELHVNGTRGLRLEPGGSGEGAPNVIGGSSANYVADGTVGATIGGGGAVNYGLQNNGPIINSVTADFGTVGGGLNNTASGGATVAGGVVNSAGGDDATVGGGTANNAAGVYATVGGGVGNTAGDAGTVGGGYNNTAGAYAATVGGGQNNDVTGDYGTVGGGFGNLASGEYATVPGGYVNLAQGEFSFAAGNRANAANQGAFVWADSQPPQFSSTANDQFCIRAQGGVMLDNSTSMAFGSQPREMLQLYRDATATFIYGIGVQTATFYTRTGTNGGFAWYQGGIYNGNQNNAGGGKTMMTLGNTGNLTIAGTLAQNSDRRIKSGFQPVDARQVLEKVAAMAVTRWHYTNDVIAPHIGPMAQDFYAAFGLGEDDKHITTVDEGGVALAAIQGLNQKLNEKDAEIETLEKQNDSLAARLNELETAVKALAKKK